MLVFGRPGASDSPPALRNRTTPPVKAQEEKAAATKVANMAKKNAKAAEGTKSLASFFTKKPAAPPPAS